MPYRCGSASANFSSKLLRAFQVVLDCRQRSLRRLSEIGVRTRVGEAPLDRFGLRMRQYLLLDVGFVEFRAAQALQAADASQLHNHFSGNHTRGQKSSDSQPLERNRNQNRNRRRLDAGTLGRRASVHCRCPATQRRLVQRCIKLDSLRRPDTISADIYPPELS